MPDARRCQVVVDVDGLSADGVELRPGKIALARVLADRMGVARVGFVRRKRATERGAEDRVVAVERRSHCDGREPAVPNRGDP